jgi:hypothetical protein
MTMVPRETFADKEVARVYIAGRPGEAILVEKTLSAHGIDFVVEIEPFETHLLGVLPREYEGVAFYVLSGQGGFCRRILREAGLRAGLVELE